MKALEEANKVEQYVIDIRRHFHKHPELSWLEFETSGKICEELDKMNIPFVRVCDTGVIGVIEGRRKKPVIGIRADIDAIAVQEETDLEFKSVNDGVMHACGHETHVSMVLGAARILNAYKDELDCTVKLIFQPAEESMADSGAERMIALDEMKDIDNIVSLHIWPQLDAGAISVEAGPRFASADTFKIEVKGKGGHGGMPEQAIDPIAAACALVSSMQTLVSREISPLDACVVSVCLLNAGTAVNVIPETAVLEGTIRAFRNEVRSSLPGKMERIVANTCKSYRCDYIFEYYPGTPPTVNDEASIKVAENAVRNALGGEWLIKCPPTTGSDDMAKMLEKIPGCYGFIGAKQTTGENYPHHNPKFNVNEAAMKNGVAFFVQYVLDMQHEVDAE